MTSDEYYTKRHQAIALPCVRIRSGRSGGSGTVIYSANGSTYVLTNHHVVSNAIKIEKQWSTLLKAERKTDAFDAVDVHLFEYAYESRSIGGLSIQSDVMAYDPDEDLALLRLRTSKPVDHVATLYPRGEESKLRTGMPVLCIGAGLGEPPVQTSGFLSQFGQEIDRREYWLSTAPSIFGNSGGSLYLAETFELIGVPARIAVAILGFSADAITHLSYSVPITRIYQFLEDQRFRFVYDPDTYTEEGEEEERDRLREREEYRLRHVEDGGSEMGGVLATKPQGPDDDIPF